MKNNLCSLKSRISTFKFFLKDHIELRVYQIHWTYDQMWLNFFCESVYFKDLFPRSQKMNRECIKEATQWYRQVVVTHKDSIFTILIWNWNADTRLERYRIIIICIHLSVCYDFVAIMHRFPYHTETAYSIVTISAPHCDNHFLSFVGFAYIIFLRSLSGCMVVEFPGIFKLSE